MDASLVNHGKLQDQLHCTYHTRYTASLQKITPELISRTLCSTGHKSKFEERMKKTTKHNAVKKLETELREEKHAEKQR